MFDTSCEREISVEFGREYLRSLLSLSTHVPPLPSISPKCRMSERVRNSKQGSRLETQEGFWA